MITFVIVSHSARLAEGVRELAAQMVADTVPLAVAGGIDDPKNPLGTDPLTVLEAIESVYNEDGVVVLMDLGSALLSAESALDLLPPEKQAHVHLCEAPLVEGTVAAVVQAMTGGSITQVMEEARTALTAKQTHFQPRGKTAEIAVTTPPEAQTADATLRLIIPNKLGLHTRPAAKLVGVAGQFAAHITVLHAHRRANAKSINQVATLAARQGDELIFYATGRDASPALRAIQALADDNFGDNDAILPQRVIEKRHPTLLTADELTGIGAAEGIAIGPAFLYQPQLPAVITRTVSDSEAEWQRLQRAIAAAVTELQQVATQVAQNAGDAEAAIFEAHRLLAQDPDLLSRTQQQISTHHVNAEAAWQQTIEETAATFRRLEDAYLQQRATDVQDVGQRVLRHLLGTTLPTLDFAEPHILVTRDLTPSDTARLNPDKVSGIITEVGGVTSHSAIIARTLGIPAVVGAAGVLNSVQNHQLVAFDGAVGYIWLSPGEEHLADLQQRREAWLSQVHRRKAAGQQTAATQDGRRIEVAANIGGPQDVPVALEYGAEGVGLFRTEFLFMERREPPDEEEQYATYRQVAQAMDGRPVIIRTLDVGGDKPIPYLGISAEENPFLGWRGIRYCLDTPEIFKPQLRAICRASADHPIKLMFPMVGTLEEVHRARQFLQQVQDELTAENLACNPAMEVGVMIEVPSAVLIANQLAQAVDFFSIGTNDLTQYMMAADRGNARVATLVNALQPAVLRAIQQTVEVAHRAGIWVGLCGELAGNALTAPLLIGLGLDELSMSAPAIPAVKQAIVCSSIPNAQKLARAVLSANTVADILSLLRAYAHEVEA